MTIEAIALDVDGVFTDGGFWLGTDGNELKRFSFRDVMAVSLGRKAGLRFALISGEDGPLLDSLARKLGIHEVHGKCREKGDALRAFAEKENLSLQSICFMGDDINDLSAMEIAGLSACPSDAHSKVKAKANWVMQCGGGQGVVRELIDRLLEVEVEHH